jgi:hypothetical protein
MTASAPRLALLAAAALALAALDACSPDPNAGPSLRDVMEPGGESPSASQLAALPWLDLSVSPATGTATMVRAIDPGATLSPDDPSLAPEERARRFLADYGGVVGLDAGDRAALPVRARGLEIDPAGASHVRLEQRHLGLPVVGGELVIHMDRRGIIAVNGTWIPAIDVETAPAIGAASAKSAARRALGKELSTAATPAGAELAIYRTGLLRGAPGRTALAWGVEVSDGHRRHMVWIDAARGALLDRYRLDHDALERVVWSPEYDPANPLYIRRSEGDPPDPLLAPVNNLYDFSGHTYDLFAGGFGRDSFDGAGATMNTVYLVNGNCPNAYWDGSTTNYCPGFDLDDVVAHEWGHAYTQHTHGLIYSYQSGALNEAYSDIWGEIVDLLNGVDGLGGANNAEPAPEGVRWAVGEDFGTGSGEYELLLRDMCHPERLGYPGRVSAAEYHCDASDGGGVHYNSGIPNHAFAMLVDGEAMCGYDDDDVDVEAIGIVKAAHIYFRAMTVYQTPSTTFAQHADALEASCADLVGAALSPFLGQPDPGAITAADCEQVANAIAATEMRAEPPCNFDVMLDPDTPATCDGAAVVFAEDWSTGLEGWSTASSGVNPEWPGYEWTVVGSKPDGIPGSAAFAVDSKAGTCAPGGDYSGTFSLDSPAIAIPADGGRLELRFEHYVETEAGYDGGNVLISVNGAPFELVPQDHYAFNRPPSALEAAPPLGQNTNPKAGEFAWHGVNTGEAKGSWGTTIIDLGGLAGPGDQVRVRFDFGIDGCNGVTGWYIGDVALHDCPELPGPVLALGDDYEDPDTDGRFTLVWERPEGAMASDEIEESTVSCAPRLADDAESDTGLWTASATGLGTFDWDRQADKPGHDSTAWRAIGVEGTGNAESVLTLASPLALPAAGDIGLSFRDWFVNEPDDRGVVEISADGGTSWTAVYETDRNLPAVDAEVAFATEPLEARRIDLTAYAGKQILVRFRYVLGGSNFFLYTPLGWWVDDIQIEVDDWYQVAKSSRSEKTLKRDSGSYCYRVSTKYRIDRMRLRSSWSNVVAVEVE